MTDTGGHREIQARSPVSFLRLYHPVFFPPTWIPILKHSNSGNVNLYFK